MKKTLLKMFAPVAMSCVVLSASAYDFEVDGVYYNVLKNTQNASVTYKDTKYESYSGAVVIPEKVTNNDVTYTVTELGKYAMRNSAAMTSITLPKTLKAIQSGAFSKCDGLKSITIPDSVTTIGTLAIQDCPNLAEINLGSGLEDIGGSAFMGDVALKRITIPESVTSIGASAFANCTTLVEMKVPAAVNKIGNSAFQGCLALKDIEIDTANAVYASVDGVVFSKDKTILYTYPAGRTDTVYTVPDGVTKINFAAFYQRVIKVGTTLYFSENPLAEINLPESVTELGNSAFEWLKELKRINIPNNVKSIGNATFRNCESLVDIEIPDSTKTLDTYAFKDCKALESVSIGSGMTTLGQDVFTGCAKINSVVCKAVVPPTAKKEPTFDNAVYAAASLTVPTESVEAYKAATPWSSFAKVYGKNFSGVEKVVAAEDAEVVAIYNLQGIRYSELRPGLNIVKMSDGTTRKVLVKE